MTASAAGVAEDADGNLYLPYPAAGQILRWEATTGKVTVFASGLSAPVGVAIDASGNLYIATSAGLNYVAAGTSTVAATSLTGAITAVAVSPSGLPVAISGNQLYIASGTGPQNFTFATINTGSTTLSNPMGVAFDASGNVYVADYGNNQVEEISPATSGSFSSASANTVSIVLSNSVISNDPNAVLTNSNASGGNYLQGPTGVAVDSQGNLYVDNSGDQNILKVELATGSQPIIENIAGTGAFGTLQNARSAPAPSSEVSLSGLAVSAPAGTSGLSAAPGGLTLDAQGRLLLPTADGQIWAVPLPGAYRPRVAVGSSATEFWFIQNTMSPLTLSKSVYLSSSLTSQLVDSNEFSFASTKLLNFTTCYNSEQLAAYKFGNPKNNYCELDMTFQPSAAGLRTTPMSVITSANSISTALLGEGVAAIPAAFPGTLAATQPVTATSLVAANQMAIDPWGNVYVTDSGSAATSYSTAGIYRINSGGTLSGIFSSGSNAPEGLAFDPQGDLFVATGANLYESTVSSMTGSVPTYNSPAALSVSGLTNGSFGTIGGVVADSDGDLYVSDTSYGVVYKLSQESGSWVAQIVAGVPSSTASGSCSGGPQSSPWGDGGLATAANLCHPAALAVDNSGDLYVSDAQHGLVRRIQAGVISTVASSVTAGGLAVDAGGNLYISSSASGNSVLDVVYAAGSSAPSSVYPVAGSGTSTSVTTPAGVVVDGAGNIYVADSGASGSANAVRELAPPNGSVNFGTVNIGTSSTQLVPIVNMGNTGIDWASSNTVSSNASQFTPNSSATGATCSYSSALSGGTGCLAAITFTPDSSGTVNGVVTYGLNGSSVAVAVTGIGHSTQASQTITFTPPATETYGSAPITLSATATSGLPVTFSVISGPATISGNLLTITGVGSVVVEADQAGNSSYLAAPSVQATITVQKASLTVTAKDATRVYGSANPTFGFTVTGFVNGDSSSVVSGSPTLATTATTTSPAGTYPITAALGTLSAANYDFTFANGTLTVGKATLTVTPVAASRTYGAANPAFTDTITGFVNGDTASVVTGAAALTTTATATSPVGSYTITAAQGSLAAANYDFTFGTGSLTVNPAVLTVTANNASRPYNSANPTLTDTITGFVNNETASVVSGAAALSTTATTTSPVGNYPITVAAGSLSATNYTFTFVPGTLTITKATPAVSWTPATTTITYGQTLDGTDLDASTPVPGTWTYTINGSPVSQPLAAGSYAITATFTPTDGTDYNGASKTLTFTVNKATLTVTPANATMTYGSALPALSGTISGAVNGDTFTASYSSTATTSSPVGSYSITATVSGANIANYTVTVTPGTLSITKATPTATWTPATTSITYGQSLDGTELDASANVPGTWAYTINGSPISQPLPAGSYDVTATFTPTDGADYNSIARTITFTVSKVTLTVTVNSATITYGDPLPTLSGTVTGTVNGDSITVSYSTTATATSAVGTYPITATVSGASQNNYTISVVPGTLTISKATPSATWTPATTTIPYGQNLDGTELNATTTVPGTWTYTINGQPISQPLPAGTYDIVATFTPTDGTDYNGVSKTITFTVTKATLTVTVNNASVTYGSALPTLTGTVTGAVNGDSVTVSYSTTATATSAVGTYPITATVSGASQSNYNVTVTPGILSITKATPAVTWTPATTTIPYGQNLDGTELNATTTVPGTWTYTINGQPISQPLPAGTYDIVATFTPTDGTDYNGVSKTITFTVTKATLTVKANDASITYGSALPTFTGSVTGAVSGDTFTETFSSTVTATSPVGTYEIIPSVTGSNLANYSVTTSSGTLTINKATPTATWTPATTTIPYGGTLDGTDLNATTTVPGTWTYTINGSPIAQPLPAGNYTVTATFTPTDTTDYNGITETVTFTVPRTAQVIDFAPLPNVNMATTTTVTLTATGGASGNPVVFTATGPVTQSGPNGSVLTLTGPGAVTVTASQAGNANFTDAAPVTQTFQVISGTLSKITLNFNRKPLKGGTTLWFDSAITTSGVTDGTVITLVNSTITFTANGTPYTLKVPNATITFSSKVTCATTKYDATTGTWETIAPLSAAGVSDADTRHDGEDHDQGKGDDRGHGLGDIFLSGLEYVVPSAGLPGDIEPITWQGYFTSSTPNVVLNWKGAAADYSRFSTDYNALGVIPSHYGACNKAHRDEDSVGSPELFERYITRAGTGDGDLDHHDWSRITKNVFGVAVTGDDDGDHHSANGGDGDGHHAGGDDHGSGDDSHHSADGDHDGSTGHQAGGDDHGSGDDSHHSADGDHDGSTGHQAGGDDHSNGDDSHHSADGDHDGSTGHQAGGDDHGSGDDSHHSADGDHHGSTGHQAGGDDHGSGDDSHHSSSNGQHDDGHSHGGHH